MSFNYKINPEIGIPLYTQLVDMIRADIRGGRLPCGTKLPTVRELSDGCGIARGTVMRAYEELEQSGIIEKIQGRGTFVSWREEDPASRKDLAMAAIDTMLDTLESLNFSRAEMNIYLELKLREREGDREAIQCAVVECNYEILSRMSEQLRQIPEISVYAYRLEDVRAYPYKLGDNVDLVIVSAPHAAELTQLLPAGTAVARAALSLVPESVSALVRIPSGSRVGILSQSARFGSLVESVCGEYARNVFLDFPQTFEDNVEQYLKGKDALLVPPDYSFFCDAATSAAIGAFAAAGGLVIPCDYRIDEGSMIYIREQIEAVSRRR